MSQQETPCNCPACQIKALMDSGKPEEVTVARLDSKEALATALMSLLGIDDKTPETLVKPDMTFRPVPFTGLLCVLNGEVQVFVSIMSGSDKIQTDPATTEALYQAICEKFKTARESGVTTDTFMYVSGKMGINMENKLVAAIPDHTEARITGLFAKNQVIDIIRQIEMPEELEKSVLGSPEFAALL